MDSLNKSPQEAAESLLIINQTVTPAFQQWSEQLARTGVSVTLWTGNAPEIADSPVTIRPLPAYDRSSTRSRLITWLHCSLVMGWRLLFTPRDVPVYGVTNPPFVPLILVLFSFVQGRRYGLLEYDIYPQIITAMGIITERHVVYRLWYRWHRQALARAALIITISDEMAAGLKNMTPEQKLPIYTIPTWTDTDWLCPLDKSDNEFVTEHHLNDKFVILYSGNLGATHSIETILDVARTLEHIPAIQFVIIGKGTKRKLVEEAVDRTGESGNLYLLPFQPKQILPCSLSSADIAIVTLGKGYGKLSMPSKTYDLLAVGNAILGISYPPNGIHTLLDTHNCGRNFEPEQVSAIRDWILSLYENPEELRTLQSNSRNLAVQKYAADVCQPALNRVIQSHLLT